MDIFILYTILYIISIVGIVVLASLVMIRRRTVENKNFGLFALLLSLWLLLQFLAQLLHEFRPELASLLLHITLALPMFFAVLFFAFTKLYMRQTIAIAKHLIVPGLWAAIVLLPGVVIQEAMVDYNGITLTTTPLYYFELAFIVAYIFLAARLLLKDARSNLLARRYRARFLIFSVLQALVIIVGAILIFPDVLWSQLAIPIACFFMVALFSYAIIKHRLFDIRLIIARSLAYIFSIVFLGIIYVLVAFVLLATVFGGPQLTIGQQALYIALAMVLALTFAPLKRFFDRITTAIFYRDAYETQAVLDQMSSLVVRVVSVKKLSQLSLEIIGQFIKPRYSLLIVRDGDTANAGTVTWGKVPEGAGEGIESLAMKLKDAITIVDDLDDAQKATQDLRAHGVSLIARLETSKELIGFLVLGPKASGGIFSTQDVNVLKIIADELAVAVQNALRFEEISRFNETLQAQVNEATHKLRESNRQLKQLDSAKDEFISIASHQLRTPLTSVKGYLSMALEGDAGPMNASQKRLIEEAYASAQRMVYLIGDFLNVSRLKTGKFIIEPTPVALNDLINEEIEQLRATALARGLTIEANVPHDFPQLLLDENKIRQVIMNFIDNAIFYSTAGSKIEIDLMKTAESVTFTVRDHGIGVPAKERHQLFDKFFRASNAREMRPDGTGIGLFMAKKVVIAHGGSIIFKSEEGKGSTFGFTFPISITDLSKNKSKRLG